MWTPRSIADIETAVAEGFEEHAHLDYKRQLPDSKRNVDLAIDVAAMSSDGGVLVYGVAEDEANRPSEIVPIDGLQACRERIANVVEHSVAGTIRLEVRALESPTGPDRGCLAVVVPASPDAPHMVFSTNRFYGRGATGNRILSQADVDRLYARRRRLSVDRSAMLDAEIARWPVNLGKVAGRFIVWARPALAEDGLLDRYRRRDGKLPTGPRATMRPLIDEATRRCLNRQGWIPRLEEVTNIDEAPGGGFRGSYLEPDEPFDRERALIVHVDGDGSVAAYCGKATTELSGGGPFLLEEYVATLTAQVLAIEGVLLERVGHTGPVDVGFDAVGLLAARSAELSARQGLLGPRPRPYGEPRYRKTACVEASELILDSPAVAHRLVGAMVRVTAGEDFDPVRAVRP